MIEKLFNRQEQETEEHWVSISDVMAGLMVIFLFIAISYMVHANKEKERLVILEGTLKDLLDVYTNLQRALFEDLQKEFEDDPEWTGTLDPETLSIRFKNPFTQGDATVPNSFKKVLNDFFPRYIKILTKSKYKKDIAEIRIEGHTSSEWFDTVGLDRAYYNNMKLSQDRARNVLQYVLEMSHPQATQNKEWIKKYLTANGLSSSKLLFHQDGTQNKEESRRVEFRVVTKLEKLIDKIKEIMRASEKEGEEK
ncbi:MAG: OmpA family protein [Candidatus Poribacteria bacterium]|nr:OmpA family protein [Candidatus Poribacteria bacterium]